MTSILFSASELFISAESSDTTAPRGGRDGRRSGEDEEDFAFFLDEVLEEETDDDRFLPPFLAGLVELAWANSSAVGRGGNGKMMEGVE